MRWKGREGEGERGGRGERGKRGGGKRTKGRMRMHIH